MAEVRVSGVPELKRSLRQVQVEAGDLNMAPIASEGARLAASFAPRRTGALAGSIKGRVTRNRASIRAGAPYAGVINYGYPVRNIRPSNFMQRADLVLRRTAPQTLERQIRRIIAERGLE